MLNLATEAAEPPLASWASRLMAFVIDLLLMLFVAGVPYILFQNSGLVSSKGGIFDTNVANLTRDILLLFSWSVYVLIMLRPGRRRGQTLGKQLVHIRVICPHEAQPPYWRYLGRELAKPVLYLLALMGFLYLFIVTIYCLAPILNKRRQMAHDYFFKTQVVEEGYLLESISFIEVVE